MNSLYVVALMRNVMGNSLQEIENSGIQDTCTLITFTAALTSSTTTKNPDISGKMSATKK